MKKVFAVFLTAVFALPVMAFASSPLYDSPRPYISEEKARNIVESWGVSVTRAELSYEEITLWNVYGHHTVSIGPAKIKMNLVVKLDATDGEFVGLEMKRRNLDYDQTKVLEKMKQYDIVVQNIQLVRNHNPYWEIHATKSMTIDGFWFDVPLYIHVDARTLAVTHISHEPIYTVQPAYPEPASPMPWYGGIVEQVTAIKETMASTDAVASHSPTPTEIEIESDDAVEVQ